MLSLLVPTKDRYDELIILLRRLESESPAHIKVFISDNCSHDARYVGKLPQIIAKHPLDITLTRQLHPLSAFENWKTLIHKITTRYAAFCGDDDFWSPGGLTKTVAWMIENNIDLSYTAEWHLHSRELPHQSLIKINRLFALPQAPLARVIEFIKYNNDPIAYALMETKLLTKMFSEFRTHWSFLPRSHITNTAYTGVAVALLAARNAEWYQHAFHSQGVAPAERMREKSMSAKTIDFSLENIYYIIRRIQICSRMLIISYSFKKSLTEYCIFSLKLIFFTACNLPLFSLLRRNAKSHRLNAFNRPRSRHSATSVPSRK
jgi:hypothetical protein